MKLALFLLALPLSAQAVASIRCTEHFAGRLWQGEPAPDFETAKDNAVTACTQNWVAPED
jgi:hypothetical protein